MKKKNFFWFQHTEKAVRERKNKNKEEVVSASRGSVREP
jgi:hypothetical protein